ncbi:Bug family tripartite tricarboxylate transporter substrate binding protein [Natrarchaeobius oligotrophus]|uniref:Bug family tripartite tricarboxylate transporter substrate binding protein n=1 Tax=Natrarchaeobius oligotrophus TaxID=3455743 RepID=UPI0014052570|nr:tripartite tricarboxylate transporter substrate-binding protein [Natrarchaeobius chitinivorans]
MSTAALTGVAGCLGDDENGEFPDQRINLISTYPEGSGTTAIAHRLGTEITEQSGADVEVEPIGGAAGLRGTGELFGREADGYTFALLWSPSQPLATATNPPDWDILDLSGVAEIGAYTLSLVANPDYEFEDFHDLVDRYNDGEFDTVGGLAVGHAWHITLAIARQEADWNWSNFVTFDGTNDAIRGVAAGEVPAAITTTDVAITADQEGEIDLINNFVSDGDPNAPDVPAWVDDLGMPNIDFISRYNLLAVAPPDLDADRRDELVDVLSDCVESEEYQEWADETNRIAGMGATGDDVNDMMGTVIEEIPERLDLDELLEE